MNSYILLKGVREPIRVKTTEAEHVLKVRDDKNIPSDTMIHLGNFHFTKGEVKFVEVNADLNQGRWERSIEEENKKGSDDRKRFLRKSVEDKANNLEMFKLLYKLSTGDEASEDVKRSAYFIQFRFFTERPTRQLCDAHLLHTVIPTVNKKISPFVYGGLSFIENCLMNDMRLSSVPRLGSVTSQNNVGR